MPDFSRDFESQFDIDYQELYLHWCVVELDEFWWDFFDIIEMRLRMGLPDLLKDI